MGPLRPYAPTALYSRKKESQFFSAYYSKPSKAAGLLLKVSKYRKQILKFSFELKNGQKYFCISALASKKIH